VNKQKFGSTEPARTNLLLKLKPYHWWLHVIMFELSFTISFNSLIKKKKLFEASKW